MRENGEHSRQRQPRRVARSARLFGAFALIGLACALTAGPAAAEYTFKGTFAGPGAGSGNGELSTPGRAAVEQSTGDLFVVDSGNDRVQVFRPTAAGTAEYLTQFGGGELSAPWGVALAEEGGDTYVYVADAGNNRIVKYDSDGEATPSFTVDPDFTSPAAGAGTGEVGSFHAALAVDPTTGDLLVADDANKRIERFESDGTFVSSFDGTDGGSALEGPIDLATNSTGDIYVVDANGNIAEAQGTSKVLRYHADGKYVTTLGPVGTHERPATVAVNPTNDEVIVSGDQDNVYEAGPAPFVPVLQIFNSSNQALPSPAVNTTATDDTVSGLGIAGGDPDRLYVVLDVGRYFGSPFGVPQIQAFRQPHPVAPRILAEGAGAAVGESTLTGAIETGNASTEYHFEWGTTGAYGNRTPTETLAPAEGVSHVRALLTGLAAGVTYHYRLVATNPKGTAEGADSTFATLGPTGPETCPNAAIREAQHSTELPECRAFEMVSPVDKNGNEVTGFFTVQGAPGGDRVAYGSTGAFPMSEASLPESSYLSVRGDEGWATRALTPPQKNDAEIIGGVSRDFSEDLGRGLTFSRVALTPDAVDGASNVYLQDNLTGALTYVASSPGAALFNRGSNTGGSPIKGGSSTYDHVVLVAEQALVPGAPEGTDSVYDVTRNGPSLVSILPDGSPAAGAGVGVEQPIQSSDHPVSADGRRIFFESARRLYERIDGTETVELSSSEISGAQGDSDARFGAASADGKVAFFTARARLTLAGEPDPPTGFPPARLYRYSGGHLEELAKSSTGIGSFVEVLGVSESGDTAYFVVTDRPEGDPAPGSRVYRWHLGEGVSEAFSFEALGPFDEAPRDWTTSPDGRFAAFEALSFLTPNALPGPTCEPDDASGHQKLPAHCFQVYVYDATTGKVSCASCSPFGEAPIGASTIGSLFGGGSAPLMFSRHAARGIANDGTLYFDSPSRLTADDGDGKRDVYEWQNGKITLLTPNTPTDVAYADASADGSTVFVLTASRLVGQDQDSSMDVYAIRRDGGIPAQNLAPAPAPCEGDACQGASATTPATSRPGSSDLKGSSARVSRGKAVIQVPSKVRIHGIVGFVSVRVSGPGRVSVTGKGLYSAARGFKGPGSARLRLRLTAQTRGQLARTGTLRREASIRFRPPEGRSQMRKVAVVFVAGEGK